MMAANARFRNGQDRSLQRFYYALPNLKRSVGRCARRRVSEANRRQAALRPEMGALTPLRRNLAGYAKRRKPFAGADARIGPRTDFAGISHFTLRRRAHNVRPYGLFSVKPEIPVVLTLFSSLYTQKTQTRSFCTHAQRGRFLLPLPAAAEHPGISSLCNQ